jgi:hypothetical protein
MASEIKVIQQGATASNKLVRSGEARLGRGGLFAGWIETDHIFVQLLRVREVHLALFELGGLEQLSGPVAGTAQ